MILCSWFFSQHHHPLAYSMLMFFRGSLATLFVTCLDDEFVSLRAKPSWVTGVCILTGLRHEFACYRVQTMRSSLGVSGPLTHMRCCLPMNIFCCSRTPVRPFWNQFTTHCWRSRIDRDGQEGELDARVLAYLCSRARRHFRKLVRINKQSSDIAGGVHVGKDDLDVGAGDQGIMFGYAGDETGETEMRILMVGLDAGGKTTIFF